MYRTWNDLIALAYCVVGALLLAFVLLRFAIWLIIGFIGYKLLENGLRMYGYPPLSYWISWIRAQWRI